MSAEGLILRYKKGGKYLCARGGVTVVRHHTLGPRAKSGACDVAHDFVRRVEMSRWFRFCACHALALVDLVSQCEWHARFLTALMGGYQERGL